MLRPSADGLQVGPQDFLAKNGDVLIFLQHSPAYCRIAADTAQNGAYGRWKFFQP